MSRADNDCPCNDCPPEVQRFCWNELKMECGSYKKWKMLRDRKAVFIK